MQSGSIRYTEELAAVLVTLLAQTVLAGDWKWNREKEKWWYLDDQNTYPVNGWEWIDGKCYRFDEEGYLYVDTVTPEGLTVNANGEWTVNGVVQEMETVLKENPPKQETVVVETAAETQPAATEPETKAAETTAAETLPAVETEPETKPAETTAAETLPAAETTAAETQPAEILEKFYPQNCGLPGAVDGRDVHTAYIGLIEDAYIIE